MGTTEIWMMRKGEFLILNLLFLLRAIVRSCSWSPYPTIAPPLLSRLWTILSFDLINGSYTALVNHRLLALKEIEMQKDYSA